MKFTLLLITLFLFIISGACGSGVRVAPTGTSSPITAQTQKPTETITPKPAASQTPTRTITPTNTPTPTHIITPTRTPTPTLPPPQGVFLPFTSIVAVLPGTVTGLYATVDGALWLVTDRGVANLVDATWNVYSADFAGKLVSVDEVGRVWVLNEDASEISAWDGETWAVFDQDAGWIPLVDWFINVNWGEVDGSGRLWLTTSQDVRVFDGERWEVYIPEDMGMGPPEFDDLVSDFVVNVLEESDEVWVGECDWGGPGPFGGRGVRWFDGETWQGANSPVASGCVTVIEEDSSGLVWVSLEGDLWRYTPTSGNWTRFSPPEPEDANRYGFATAITLDAVGDPWPIMAPCGGASCFIGVVSFHVNNGVWTQIAGREEYGPQRVVFGEDSTPWLFIDVGVYRVVEDVPRLASELFVQHLAVDAQGKVWVVAWHDDIEYLWVLEGASR